MISGTYKRKTFTILEKINCIEPEKFGCDLGLNIGFEQDGTGKNNGRPILILQGFSKEVCLIVPLSTSRKENKYYLNVGKIKGRQSSVILSQIRLLDTKRLVNKIGKMEKEKFEEIRKAVKNLI